MTDVKPERDVKPEFDWPEAHDPPSEPIDKTLPLADEIEPYKEPTDEPKPVKAKGKKKSESSNA